MKRLQVDIPPVAFLFVVLGTIALALQCAVLYFHGKSVSEPKQLLCSMTGEAYLQFENNQVHRVPHGDEYCVVTPSSNRPQEPVK